MEEVVQSPVQLNDDPEIDAFLRTANVMPIQEILNNCLTNPGFNILCNEYEKELWTYLLKKDFPSWGVTDNPREYYLRIAKINGIPYANTSKYTNIPGDKLLSEQERQPFLMMKIGDTEPFPIPDILARAYSGLFDALIDRNLTQGITDQNLWTVNVPIDTLIVKTQGAEVALRKYFRAVLSQNIFGYISYLFEIDAINITNLLQCRELLCDSLIGVVEARMARLENDLAQNNIFKEEVDYLVLEFAVAPGYVASYLKSMSNLLYRTDNFTQDFIDYFKEIIGRIPNISVALLPSGYPFTKRNNIDRIDQNLFVINPFKQPVVSPDYLSADVVATLRRDTIDDQGREIKLWKAGPPPPIIENYPTQEEVLSRMEVSFPTITEFITGLQEKFRATFPRGEGGFILAGGMISMAFDNWMADPRSHWLLKTDADIFVYGWNIEYRMKAFDLIFNEMLDKFPSDPKTWQTSFQYGVWQSVLTAQKRVYYDHNYNEIPYDQINLGLEDPKTHQGSAYKGRFARSIAMQVINTNSKNGYEVIMNFDTSHIQIGWDCHKGWMATPYWELYFPRRESLLVRYNIRSHRLAKTLFKGFTLKMLMPYSLILTPKGVGYSHVLRPENIIEIIPDHNHTYADDLRLRHSGLVRLDHVSGQYIDNDTGAKGDNHFRSEPQQDVPYIKIYTEGRVQRIVIAASTIGVDEPASGQYSGTGTKEQLLKLREQIKFDGQFKNGFDAYVRERYLTYDLNHIDLRKVSRVKTGIEKDVDVDNLTLEQIIGEIAILPDTRFVMRDCKILFDPREKLVEYNPTTKFAFSLKSDILRKIKVKEFVPTYMGDDPYKRGLAFAKLREKGLFDGNYDRTREPSDQSDGKKIPDGDGQNVPLEVEVIANDSDQTRESEVISNRPNINKYIIRSLFCFPVEIEGIIQLTIDPAKKNAGLNEELNPKLGGKDVTYMESLPKEILQGMIESNTIKGRDLIALCNSSPKLRETCLASKNLVDKSGKVYDVQTQYVYRKALEELNIPIPDGTEPAEVYGRFLNGYRYYSLNRHLAPGENGHRKYIKTLITHTSQLIHYNSQNLPIVTIEQINDHNSKIDLIPRQPQVLRVLVDESKDFSIDNTDLHDRFYSDEEREQLPLFDHRQWQEIRVGKLKLPAEVTAIRVRTPAIVQESLFLNADDWTMPVEEVLAKRNELMFNCLCYQDMTSTLEDGTLIRGSVSIFRAFMIYQ